MEIEKNLENLDQNHEKIQEIIKKINPQTNITFPPLLERQRIII